MYNRAFCWDRTGEYILAAEGYTDALRLQPNNGNAFHNRGAVWEKVGEKEKARADFQEAIKVDPNAHSSMHALGMMLEREGRRVEALDFFDLAIKMFQMTKEDEGEEASPKSAVGNIIYLHNRGFCRREMGDWKGAVADFDECLAIDQKHFSSYTNRGFCYRKLGMFKMAIKDYSRSIELDANYIKSYNNRAFCRAKIEDFVGAVEDYTKVIDIEGRTASGGSGSGSGSGSGTIHARHNRGISFEKLGEWVKAAEDFRWCLREGVGGAKEEDVRMLLRGVEEKLMINEM